MTKIISLETIEKDTLWVAKMQGWRQVGTYEEIGHLFNDDDCRDFDLLAEQPEHLKPFYDMYFKYEREHGWITIPEYYKDVYLVEAQDQQKQKRVWTEEEIRTLIQTNDTVLYRALLKLYDCQTATEQETHSTRNKNGEGFNSYDAKFLTDVAKFYKARGYLTNGQKAVTRRKLVKYNKQLTRLANA